LGVAFVGVLIVGFSDTCVLNSQGVMCPTFGDFIHQKSFLGNVLAVTGAIMAAGYVLIGRRMRKNVSAISYVTIVYGVAALLLLTIVFIAGLPIFGYPFMAYVWFLLIALVPQLIGHSSFNWVLGFLSAAFVSIALLGEPIGSTILAYFIFEEVPSQLKIVGAILILIGIIVAARSEPSLHANTS